MVRRYSSGSHKHMLVSDSKTEFDNNHSNIAVAVEGNPNSKRNGKGKKLLSPDKVAKPNVDRDALVELAKEYQKHMKNIPIPLGRLDEIVVFNWKDLAKILKRIYGQPIHYLTYKLCNQWDQFRSEDEEKPLNAILNWRDIEDTIWRIETVHRSCTSPVYLAMLWLGDPGYQAIVDEVIPSL